MNGLETVETVDSRPQGVDYGAVAALFATLAAMLSGKFYFTNAGPGATMIVGLIASLMIFGHGAIGSRALKVKNDLRHAANNSWATAAILAALFVAMSQSSAIEGVDPTTFGFWGTAALTSISAVAENNAFIGSLQGILRGEDLLLQALVIFGVGAFGNLTLFGCVGSAISGLRMADFVRFLGLGVAWVAAGLAGMWALGPAAIRTVTWIRNEAVARLSESASFYWIEFQMRLGRLWTELLDAFGLEPVSALDAAHGLIPAGDSDESAAT